MRKLDVFCSLSLDGYFTDAQGDMSWAHAGPEDAEWNAFSAANAKGGGPMLFGRITYEMMASYWPTPQAAKNAPDVAEGMNRLPKLVFSRTLEKASWQNTQLFKGNLLEEVRKLKQAPGDDMVILGSGSLVAQLAPAGLIDNYQLVITPVALGAGRSLFQGIEEQLRLKLTNSRAFANGKVVLTYASGR